MCLMLTIGPCVDLPVKHSRVFALTSGLPLREELVIQLHVVGYLDDNPGVDEGRELESQGVTPVPFSKRTCIPMHFTLQGFCLQKGWVSIRVGQPVFYAVEIESTSSH